MGGWNLEVEAQEEKVCPFICFETKYMICPGLGYIPVNGCMNCCLAPNKFCTLYLTDGHKMKCQG